jgi:bifunctional DNA-binding transcriptional regulator/antitoxin component of YhaV-PrlF toxin-antitoxin module
MGNSGPKNKSANHKKKQYGLDEGDIVEYIIMYSIKPYVIEAESKFQGVQI